MPQKNVDCMPCAACCVGAWQALLACEVAPADSAVISVIELQMEDGQLLSIMPSKINIVGASYYACSTCTSPALTAVKA